ncbi:hypothetical protein D9M70_548710 [compost metagenome]
MRAHEDEEQARHQCPAQPTPGVVVLGQGIEEEAQLQGQHAEDQPAAKHMDCACRRLRQQITQAPERQQMHQQQRQPPQPAEVRQWMVFRLPCARQSQAGQRHQGQAEQRQGAPLFAQSEQRPQRHAQRRHQ